MSVIPITVFFSLLLAGTFVVLFLREQNRRGLGSPERDSLLPLADEKPAIASYPARAGVDRHAEAHDHDAGGLAGTGCGCRDGSRPPCEGCSRERLYPSPVSPAHFSRQ